ncbi:DMT family transporter [Neptunicella marina]|uniref:DMT family transporter n=1 Tax=Neptunicella marina TaxID=2125989 RepID=A0A8J6IUI3_9ALTE|nr:DMT family transporter [Neptunicella marina]MBC3765718.1 DMT family transporter [Neptunicella marina]
MYNFLQRLQSPYVSGLLLALCGTFMFSTKPILIKQVYQLGVDSSQLIALRMLFAAPLYFIVGCVLWFKHQPKQREYIANAPVILLLGILGYYIASYLDLMALQYISAQLERVVLFCFPTLVVLFSRWFLKTPMPRNIGWVLGLSYLGIFLIFGHDIITLGDEVALGTFLVFIGAVSFAFYTLFSKKLIGRVGSLMFTCIAMISASMVIFIHFALTHDFAALNVGNEALLLTATIAIFATVIPSFLVAEAISRLGPEQTSVVGTTGPVITSILAVIILGEAFTPYHFAGLSLVILAVYIMIKSR